MNLLLHILIDIEMPQNIDSLDWYFVSILSLRQCLYHCRSCRVAPLVQCDFCPLLFHMDCLNPPLTSLPTGRWMCPNHVENFLVCYRGILSHGFGVLFILCNTRAGWISYTFLWWFIVMFFYTFIYIGQDKGYVLFPVFI